jgi:hypothetical protein
MWDLYGGNGHNPHKGMVSAGLDECGAELGAKGKGMVLKGDPRKYSQSPSGTLHSVWRGRTQYRGQDRSTDVAFLYGTLQKSTTWIKRTKALPTLGCQGGSRVLEDIYRVRGRALIKVLGTVSRSGWDPVPHQWKGHVS